MAIRTRRVCAMWAVPDRRRSAHQWAARLLRLAATPTRSYGRRRRRTGIGNGGGSTTTAGGLVFHGEPDGNIQAYDAKTGELLWQFQTGFGAEAPPVIYEVDGDQYVAIAAGGNQLTGSAYGDAVWAF